MPKPGKFKNSWKNQYNEHDYRDSNERKVRVSFKPSRLGRKDQTKDWGASIRAHLEEEEDIDMGQVGSGQGISYNNKKYNKKRGGRRSGSPVPHRSHFRGKLIESPMSWYRVLLPYGNKYDKEFIIKTLLDNISPSPLLPVAWKINGSAIMFYIDDFKTASKLYDLDKRIQTADGFKMIIKVSPGSPSIEITSELEEKMKLIMAKRYNALTKALDLTRFHADPELVHTFCALSKPYTLVCVINIIIKNIPELEALNLDNNNLQMFTHIKKIIKKLVHLKVLHLGHNKVRDVTMLDPLIGLPVVDLVLDGNPLCDKFHNKMTYIRLALIVIKPGPTAQIFSVCSEVRKRFPKVIKLDGIDLPPPISFDVTENASLPPAQQTFLCNNEGQEIVRQFLEQYFLIYDGDSRQPLLQAYHEQAVFSMSTSYPYGKTHKNSPGLHWYSTDNRNLIKVGDPDRRLTLLKKGHLEIVNFLQEMPSTKHDLHSFTVDLTLFTPQMLVLCVSGVFRELNTGLKMPPVRSFFKTLVIIPAGGGFCICNETLYITNAIERQIQHAFKTPLPDLTATPTPSASTEPVALSPVIDENTKQQMIQLMSQQSGMNLEWSKKCLEESGWDFQKATIVFAEVQKRGSVPQEAFVK